MSKTLLTESEIRKMMGLANIGALGDRFVGRLHEQEMAEPEEDEAAGEGEMAMDDAGDEGAMADADAAPGEDESMEGAIEQVLSVVVDALGELPGAPKVTLQTDDAGGEGMDMEAGGEEMDMEAGEGEMDMEAGEEEMPAGEDEAADAALEEALRRLGVRLSESLDEDLDEGLDEVYEDDMGEGDLNLEEDLFDEDLDEGLDEVYEDDMGEADMHEMGHAAEADMGELDIKMEEDLVNEVTRRVSARLLKRLKR